MKKKVTLRTKLKKEKVGEFVFILAYHHRLTSQYKKLSHVK